MSKDELIAKLGELQTYSLFHSHGGSSMDKEKNLGDYYGHGEWVSVDDLLELFGIDEHEAYGPNEDRA